MVVSIVTYIRSIMVAAASAASAPRGRTALAAVAVDILVPLKVDSSSCTSAKHPFAQPYFISACRSHQPRHSRFTLRYKKSANFGAVLLHQVIRPLDCK